MPGLSLFNELSPNVIGALIGAGATLIAALINLRIAWRREVLDRLQRSRSTARGRRGLLVAITILVAAAAVGGYAGALYVMQRDRQHTTAMRAELQQQIAQIKEAAARFGESRLAERAAIEAEARVLDERRRGAEGVAATVRIAPCRPRAAGGEAPVELPACTEAEATRVAVCTPIPIDAAVVEVTPQARYEGDDADFNERRVARGGRSGLARFAEQPFERAESASTRQVCLDVWSWDSQRALDARLLVKYLPADRAEAARATPVQAAVAR
ncbi:MAG: hypothetical protein N3D71_09850 [Burkholderiaceae bacterium]|nr:hypothetical protein [Burkholderiaceae bacterium]